MMNVIIYKISREKNQSIQNLVDALMAYFTDETQGVVINEYSEDFLKATYWQKKKQKGYQYNYEKGDFDVIEEEVISAASFGIELKDKKLLVFGNKQMSQKIITIIGVASGNAYSITEFNISIEKLVDRICSDHDVTLMKMKLSDITLEQGVLVNCAVNLMTQDNPKILALKYIQNITVITFKLANIATNITVYKSGKFSISKILEEEKDEVIRKIIHIVS